MRTTDLMDARSDTADLHSPVDPTIDTAVDANPNAPFDAHADVLVVGAGPAGSACAQWLARAGWRVILADQHAFPRDKVCGDGLIPDAHAAFERLGVSAQVHARAQPVSHVGCVAPRGGRVDVAGRLAVLPRRELDEILRQAAVAAGAQWLPEARFVRPIQSRDGQRVLGAELACHVAAAAARRPYRVAAPWVVIATGAVPQALMAAGLCQRRTPSGMAVRGYIQNAAEATRIKTMDVVWHRELKRGYGWIFPCREGVFNIGVGLAHSHGADPSGRATMADVNLRELFDTFCRVHEPARRLVQAGQWLTPLKGAPLRCSLEGAELARPGLLVTGEAAGSTYAFTGEGIGKAMETGLLAAEALLAGQAKGSHTPESDAAIMRDYNERVLALKPRFELYERANRVNEAPWLVDLLVWRARRSARIMRRMEAVLEEQGNPGNLVSWRGVMKLFVPLR